jgi:hypothetical protein
MTCILPLTIGQNNIYSESRLRELRVLQPVPIPHKSMKTVMLGDIEVIGLALMFRIRTDATLVECRLKGNNAGNRIAV